MKAIRSGKTWGLLLLLATLCLCQGAEIEFVTVGDPGNAAFLHPQRNTVGLGYTLRPVGAVAYAFRIGRFEITQAQYLEFLNRVDPTGSNVLKLFTPHPVPLFGPGLFEGDDFILTPAKPEGQRYSLRTAAEANFPVVGVTWYAAARFCNWLHNNRGGPGSTEGDAATGAYDTRNFNDANVANDPLTHNPNAKYWLPTLDEWFKAAYYKGGGTNAGYWYGPFRFDGPLKTGAQFGEPYAGFPSLDPYTCNATPRSWQDSTLAPRKRTPVGSYPNATSAYGALDMGGNVNEWSEYLENSVSKGLTRRIMGGAFYWFTDHETSYAQLEFATHMHPPTRDEDGFRVVASVAVNRAPTAQGQLITTAEDLGIALTLSASDPDGNPLTYAVVSGPAHGTLSGSGPNRTFTPAANFNGSDSFTFKVNDGSLDSNLATVNLVVTAVNDAPVLQSGPAATPNPARIGQAVDFSAAASDPDGDPLSYAWNFGDGQAGSGASLTHAYSATGTYTATVTVSDGLRTASASVTVIVRDMTPPSLTVTSVVLKGNAFDDGLLGSLTVNGESTPVAGDGTWSKEVVLSNGTNVFIVRAVDAAGNETIRTITVTK